MTIPKEVFRKAPDAVRIFLFAGSIALYFFDFITIGHESAASFRLTGFDLMFGRMVQNDTITPDLWSTVIFILSASGLMCSLMRLACKGYIFLIALGAIICLILFQLKFQYRMADSGTVSFCTAYWLLLINFGLLAVFDYVKKEKAPKIKKGNETNNGFSINIITQIGNNSDKAKKL